MGPFDHRHISGLVRREGGKHGCQEEGREEARQEEGREEEVTTSFCAF
jgi:hypothetical protein